MFKRKDIVFMYRLAIVALSILGIGFKAQAQAPVANFTTKASPQGCLVNGLFKVEFIDQSTPSGNITTWLWDFGDGSTSSSQNPSKFYTAAGSYTVKLTVTNASGANTITKTNLVTAYSTPTADFTSSRTTGCFPLAIQFTDQSSTDAPSSITNWEWDFGDGATSGLKNPSHNYTQKGNLNVVLKVTNSNGCVATSNKPSPYIVISDGVKVAFSNSVSKDCKPPASIQFTNVSTGPGSLTYLWSFGDNTTATDKDPLHVYYNIGNYPVKLVVTSDQGCIDSLEKPSQINIANVQSAFSAPSDVCVNARTTFTNTSSPTPSNAIWTFGDNTAVVGGINATHIFANTGTYNVKVVNNYGNCTDSVTHPINVIGAPTAAFTTSGNTAACKAPLTVSFFDASVGAVSWKWDFGDGQTSTVKNPQHTYVNPGTFNVKLIAFNSTGCSDTISIPDSIRIKAPIVNIANLNPNGCAPYNIAPAPDVTAVDGIKSYAWTFGDGGSSTLPNPTHSYGVGAFQLTLTITTNGGCTASKTQTIKVGTPPVVNFSSSATTICAGNSIQFTDLSTPNPGVNQWEWDFGDGITSDVKNPQHAYNDVTGSPYTVTLTAYNNGCPVTTTKTAYITVNPPVPKFSFKIDCTTKTNVQFTNESTGATSVQWNFGDGSPVSTQTNPTHTFATGTYNVTLTVANGSCSGSLTQQVTIINEPADYTINPSPICRAKQALFTSTANSKNIIQYSWSFGDGSVFTGNSFTYQHIYYTPGDMTTSLTITDINGCTTTKSQVLVVNGTIPKITGPIGGCMNQSLQFTDATSVVAPNTITNWYWDFGDGTIISGTNPNPPAHKYTAGGAYSLKLKVTDRNGCVDSVVQTITISQPKASFSATKTRSCPNAPDPVVFTNSSIGESLSYLWNFGNGATNNTSANTFTYSYPATGTYDVKLKITDKNGCSDSTTQKSLVSIAIPTAAFTISDSISKCPPLTVDFKFTGTYDSTYSWTFGDGGTSTLKNPTHNYTQPGNAITAKLIVTSPGGCTASASNNHIYVYGPTGTLVYTKIGCKPLTASFSVSTTGVVNYTWDFGNNVTTTTKTPTTSYQYTQMGSYLPTVILEDINGCAVPVKGVDSIKVVDVIPAFSAPDTIFCDQGTAQFQNLTVTNTDVNYSWTFGDGGISTNASPTHLYASTVAKLYDVTMVATTALTVAQGGCAAKTLTKKSYIKVVPSPNINIKADKDFKCVPATFNFLGQVLVPDTSALTWYWDFKNGNTATVQKPDPQPYPLVNDYNVMVIATNSTGCKDTAYKLVSVKPIPVVKASGATTICRWGNTQLNVTGADSYNWLPADGSLSCYSCSSPIAAPLEDTKYFVTGSTSFGCEAKDSVTILVSQPVHIDATPIIDTSCTGQPVQLQATGAAIFTWSPATALNRTDIANPVAKPTQDIQYMVVGQDAKKCFSDTAYVNIAVFPFPSIDAGKDGTILAGESYQIVSSDGTSDIIRYHWEPAMGLNCTSCPNPIATPQKTTTYTLKVYNQAGCTATDGVTITVMCNEQNYFIPNTFSPNNDGYNDYFFPQGKGLSNIKSLRIFNRWGELVFENKNFPPNNFVYGWDGTYKGKPAPQDAYVYIIELVCENNMVIPYKGTITLIR